MMFSEMENNAQQNLLDSEFKFNVQLFIFSKTLYGYDQWKLEVKDFIKNWPIYFERIQWVQFGISFARGCQELGLPYQQYDCEAAIYKALTVWKKELILNIAHQLVYWFEDECDRNDKLVEWNEETNEIDIL